VVAVALSAFPYVGGKTILAEWIIDQLPTHTVYVEPFGGSASVLLNKPRSNVEVYNDLDGDVVQFFEVARERPDQLAEWCRRTPYSEELHGRWVREFYSGKRPDDPIKRAGRFLFLRYTQFAGKYNSPSGFKRDTPRTYAGDSQVWQQVPVRIAEVCDRLQGVSIQNRDFAEVIDHYDAPDVVFYCDPPYIDKKDTYLVEDFGHDDLADSLERIDAYALVSYTKEPDGLYDGWGQINREHYHDSGARLNKDLEQVTERLIVNYDPTEYPTFVDSQQRTLFQADGGRNAWSVSTEIDRDEGDT
jgi:DNA adenine methylase